MVQSIKSTLLSQHVFTTLYLKKSEKNETDSVSSPDFSTCPIKVMLESTNIINAGKGEQYETDSLVSLELASNLINVNKSSLARVLVVSTNIYSDIKEMY